MVIDPNLVIQLIITLTNILFQMQQRRIELDGKTRAELLGILRQLNEQMMSQPDLQK